MVMECNFYFLNIHMLYNSSDVDIWLISGSLGMGS